MSLEMRNYTAKNAAEWYVSLWDGEAKADSLQEQRVWISAPLVRQVLPEIIKMYSERGIKTRKIETKDVGDGIDTFLEIQRAAA